MLVEKGDLISATNYNSFYITIEENYTTETKCWLCKCIYTETNEIIPENIMSVVKKNYKKL